MKSGENGLDQLINFRITQALKSSGTLYRAKVIKVSPLTVQPLVLTPDRKKQTPIQGVSQLDFSYWSGTEKSRSLKVDDVVLVGVIADSVDNANGTKNYVADPNRHNSIDSSIVIGVIK